MPDPNDLQLLLGDPIPDDEARAGDPGFEEAAMGKFDSNSRKPGQCVLDESGHTLFQLTRRRSGVMIDELL